MAEGFVRMHPDFGQLEVLPGEMAVEAQDLARYRTYTLGDTVASVVGASGADSSDVKTVHERPRLMQELEWRAAYGEGADPVRTLVFSFVDDALYQIAVTYDRDRMTGLTDKDVIEGLTATYGVPTRGARGSRDATTADSNFDPAHRLVVVLRLLPQGGVHEQRHLSSERLCVHQKRDHTRRRTDL